MDSNQIPSPVKGQDLEHQAAGNAPQPRLRLRIQLRPPSNAKVETYPIHSGSPKQLHPQADQTPHPTPENPTFSGNSPNPLRKIRKIRSNPQEHQASDTPTASNTSPPTDPSRRARKKRHTSVEEITRLRHLLGYHEVRVLDLLPRDSVDKYLIWYKKRYQKPAKGSTRPKSTHTPAIRPTPTPTPAPAATLTPPPTPPTWTWSDCTTVLDRYDLNSDIDKKIKQELLAQELELELEEEPELEKWFLT